MAISVDELTTKALALPGKARALLAERIVESLDQESISEIWVTEVKKRRDEVRSGRIKPIPGAEVMKEIRKIIDDKGD